MSFTGAEFGVTEILSYLTTAKTHNYTDYALWNLLLSSGNEPGTSK